MREVERIAEQHRRAFDGGAWHGPAVFELLGDVDAGMAASRPIAGGHSIWELAMHIRTWEEAVHRRVTGRAIDVTPEMDWPTAGTSPADWKRALAALRETHDAFHRDLEAIDDARLDEPAAGSPSTIYQLLHGAVQHALYHAGQIAMLKKA